MHLKIFCHASDKHAYNYNIVHGEISKTKIEIFHKLPHSTLRLLSSCYCIH